MRTRGGVAVFVFRRDFRTHGNPAWARCVEWARACGASVAPVFIFSDRQADPSRNPYFSGPAFAALRSFLGRLSELELQGRLSAFRVRDDDTSLLEALKNMLRGGSPPGPLRAVFFNRDVTPFARARDQSIADWCGRSGVHCGWGAPGEGYLLWPAGAALTKAGTVPKTFSAFRRAVAGLSAPSAPPAAPAGGVRTVSLRAPSAEFRARGLPEPSPAELSMAASIPDAASTLAAIQSGRFDSYGATRDDYKQPTTRLSASMKFGAVAPWSVMLAARGRALAELERQLLWREFYYHLAHGYPEVLGAQGANRHIRPDRQGVAWQHGARADAALGRWAEGRTGEPLVDGAMRELRRTGYLHNRLRMVVASFLCKDLGVDWRAGEREMARMLLDYDPSQNSGGWQSMDAQLDSQRIRPSAQVRRFGNPFALDATRGRKATKGGRWPQRWITPCL